MYRVCKSTSVQCTVRPEAFTPTHAHSPTHPERLPVPQAPLVVSALYGRTNFSFILYFVIRFPCLDTQIPYVTVALCRTPRRSVAQEQGVLSGSVGVRWATAAQSLELLVHIEFSVTGVWLY